MYDDAEFYRLQVAKDLAYQNKQDAWQRRLEAKEVLDYAYKVSQESYAKKESTLQDYRRVRNDNGPLIDLSIEKRQAAFENMESELDSASEARYRKDKAAASKHERQARAYEAEAQRYVAERLKLIAEIRAARMRHLDYKRTFELASSDFKVAKKAFDIAKADHINADATYSKARSEFRKADADFKERTKNIRRYNPAITITSDITH